MSLRVTLKQKSQTLRSSRKLATFWVSRSIIFLILFTSFAFLQASQNSSHQLGASSSNVEAQASLGIGGFSATIPSDVRSSEGSSNLETLNRQTRASTRRRTGTTLSLDDSTTTQGSSTALPSSTAETLAPKDEALEKNRPNRRKKRPKVSRREGDELDDDDLDIEDEELERPMKRRRNRNKSNNSNSNTLTSSTTTEKSKVSTTSDPPTSNSTNNDRQLSRQHLDNSQFPSSLVSTQDRKKGDKTSLIDHEYYDEYEDELTTTAKTNVDGSSNSSRKLPPTMDMSKVKLVDLSQFNGTLLTEDVSVASTSTRAPESSTKTPESSSNLPADQQYSSQTGALDPRSPSLQPSSLAKRITGILTDTKNKPLQRVNILPTSTTLTFNPSNNPTSSSSPKFTYSKPYSSTTMMTPTAADRFLLQVSNQTNSPIPFNASDQTLDWSKLVKVVFKSARDNQTTYTLVMNSSELSNHPISDWSSEIPQLLSRDFEKLKQKWSNVFPIEFLKSDLGRMIISNSSLINNYDSTLMSPKLNESSLFNNINVTFSSTRNMSSSIDSINQTIPWSSTQDTLNVSSSSSSTITPSSNTSSPEKMLDTKGLDSWPLPPVNYTSNASSVENQTYISSKEIPSNASRNENKHEADDESVSVVLIKDGEKNSKEIMKDMNAEHTRIRNSVKEQTQSLRHFIVICSVSIVLAVSIIVGLIIVLSK